MQKFLQYHCKKQQNEGNLNIVLLQLDSIQYLGILSKLAKGSFANHIQPSNGLPKNNAKSNKKVIFLKSRVSSLGKKILFPFSSLASIFTNQMVLLGQLCAIVFHLYGFCIYL